MREKCPYFIGKTERTSRTPLSASSVSTLIYHSRLHICYNLLFTFYKLKGIYIITQDKGSSTSARQL